MILYKTISALQEKVNAERKKGANIGFVPTMGALHYGHISLIEASKKGNTITVCSIFVNPTQFNDTSDFDNYPSTIENDIELLVSAGCDILFLPSINEIYPTGSSFTKKYELGPLETVLEGQFRPGHYQGVCMIVHRLLDIVLPDNLYLGQKDFQQCMIIKKLIELIGMDEKITTTICPTLREIDGLAMSSRNMRLNVKERQIAPVLFKTLSFIKRNQEKNQLTELKKEAINKLEVEGLKVDYVEIANSADLSPIFEWSATIKPIVLVAAYNNDVRLIDNLLL